ncbi:hypothetical protein I302_107317 [Kwoniella bestiolae CBS 10118]|uniref:Uncharacterized protein n=1 Tax=Kwoniella bestiolae CBS 10118 TaxID=1296100 RepID=A0A1B9FYX0_9TREE|nr:hypothetical protein I302_06948 [Kwoniella bestiolae CBS 10118]OCF23962.1 hypothetical protein I302_06948 [Kwoniella bestiolae CBS 10118]
MSDLNFPPLVLASASSTIAAAAGATLIVHNTETSKTISSPACDNRAHQNGFIRHIAVSEDSKIIASVGDDKNLKVWDVAEDELRLRSTRGLIKKASCVTFSPEGGIIVSDKVGDVYLYPLDPVPSDPSTSKPPMHAMVSDPTKNPDCDYLLGHVSILTSHITTPDSKYIISADRDEHIRVSRYPKSYVMEKALFGHDSFVSSLRIPSTHPNVLISGGGDPSLRIWDWTTGQSLSKVDIYPAILPHRKVRSYLRKNRSKNRMRKVEEGTSEEKEEEEEETFYSAPEGYILPSGQGVCIKKIDSITVGDKTVVLFFSEGASAIHSFMLPSDLSSPPVVNTQPLPYPILDFTVLPNQNGKVVISLDTAWGMLKKNPGPGIESRQEAIPRDDLTKEEKEGLDGFFKVIQIGDKGEVSESSDPSLSSSILPSLPKTDLKTLSNLNLYPLINILPKWPGLEEEVEGGDPPLPPTEGEENDMISLAPTSMTARTFGGTKRNYTKEELGTMNSKVLGRLKSQGVDIGNLLVQRQKKAKEERAQKVKEANERLRVQQETRQTKEEERERKKKKVQISEEEMANA